MIEIDKLKKRILSEGIVKDGDILNVGRFLNHMVDVNLLGEIGKEFASVFNVYQPTKIITVEASGIPIATVTAMELNIPFVIAKKYSTTNLSDESYNTEVLSYTKKRKYDVRVSKELMESGDRFVILDDFLAFGEAVKGLIRLIHEAKAELVGVGICIEKSYQSGASFLHSKGICLHSLAKIESLKAGDILLK